MSIIYTQLTHWKQICPFGEYTKYPEKADLNLFMIFIWNSFFNVFPEFHENEDAIIILYVVSLYSIPED